MTSPAKIAYLGMGVMGGPMAGHLAGSGHRVTVFNRTRSRADQWLETYRGRGLDVSLAETPLAAVTGQDAVILCLGRDEDVAEMVLGERGVLSQMQPGSLLIDHTTVSPGLARQVAEAAAEREVLALDAPVSGGQSGAEKGALSIMCGGEAEAMERARPLMASYAARIVHVGTAGAGQAAKAVNQICIAGTLAGLSEAARFAQASGLDTDKVLEAISGGAAQSWQMDNRWQTMIAGEFDFGFAIDWMRKDLAIALGEAQAHDVSLPVTALVDQFYARVQGRGGGRQDTSALVRHLDS